MTTLDMLQAALAGEHACVYGYGLVGAYASDADEPAVREAYEVHRSRRELLTVQIRARSHRPVAALAAYELPLEVTDAASARRLASLLERRLAVVYADLVASTAIDALRQLAADMLVETAGWATRWAGDTTALPGIDPVPDPGG